MSSISGYGVNPQPYNLSAGLAISPQDAQGLANLPTGASDLFSSSAQPDNSGQALSSTAFPMDQSGGLPGMMMMVMTMMLEMLMGQFQQQNPFGTQGNTSDPLLSQTGLDNSSLSQNSLADPFSDQTSLDSSLLSSDTSITDPNSLYNPTSSIYDYYNQQSPDPLSTSSDNSTV